MKGKNLMLGLKLKVICEMLQEVSKEAECDISLTTLRDYETTCINLHYGSYKEGTDRMVALDMDEEDVTKIFDLDRDDTVRKESHVQE